MVRKDSPILADSLNSWFERTKSEPVYLRIENVILKRRKVILKSDNCLLMILNLGVISPYDVYFKRYGEQTGLDWRLLASVAYQESSFQSEGSSWAGAAGLMGLMPSTAASLGVDNNNLYDPESNIRAGSEYLRMLYDVFSPVEDLGEQLKMALAAYNGGIGHVFDARALAEKYGADPDIWDGMLKDIFSLNVLSSIIMIPYARTGISGDETVNYVIDVIDRWEHYKLRIKE